MASPSPQKNWKAKIVDIKSVAKDTYEITFAVNDQGFSFRAGQYVWIVLPKVLYEDPKGDRRAFSICTSPSLGNQFAIVFRGSHSGYKKTLSELPVGSEVSVNGPFGYLDFPQDHKTAVVFVAGGVGVAPFLSMVRLAAENKDPRQITLLYTNSAMDKAVYGDELSRISSLNKNITVKQKTGPIDWDFLSAATGSDGVIWYVIGTETMVRGTAKILYDHGVKEENIRFEEFYVSRDSLDRSNTKMWGTVEVFKLAVESSFNHIVLTDLDGTIVFANKGAEQITGFSKSEMIGQTPRLWGGLMDKAFYEKLWHTIKVEKKPFEADMQNRRKNGEMYHSISRISPIFGDNDNLIGFMGTEEDISQRLSLGADLKNKIDELEKINQFMIGRELKMRELKERIETLQSKIRELSGKTGAESAVGEDDDPAGDTQSTIQR